MKRHSRKNINYMHNKLKGVIVNDNYANVFIKCLLGVQLYRCYCVDCDLSPTFPPSTSSIISAELLLEFVRGE